MPNHSAALAANGPLWSADSAPISLLVDLGTICTRSGYRRVVFMDLFLFFTFSGHAFCSWSDRSDCW